MVFKMFQTLTNNPWTSHLLMRFEGNSKKARINHFYRKGNQAYPSINNSEEKILLIQSSSKFYPILLGFSGILNKGLQNRLDKSKYSFLGVC